MFFIIVAVLIFLILFRPIQYIVNLKSSVHYSKLDITLIIVFLALIFMPMCHISDADKSDDENRMLATYKPLFVDGELNQKYGEDFEKYFNDRFFGREKLIRLYNIVKLFVAPKAGNNLIPINRDGWLGLPEIPRNISDGDLKNIGDGMAVFTKFCRDNGIKCYVELVPSRIEFARDKTSRIIPESERDTGEVVQNYLLKRLGFDVVFPLNEMLVADKSDMVYFKTDHHWSDFGAWIGYQSLMKRIGRDFPDLVVLDEKDYDVFYSNKVRAEYNRIFFKGSQCKSLNWTDEECPLDVKYRYYKHKDEDKVTVSFANGRDCDFNAPFAKNKYKVFMIGNSFMENLAYFMAESFVDVRKRRNNGTKDFDTDNMFFSRWKDEVLQYRPDILVIVVNSDYSLYFKDLKD